MPRPRLRVSVRWTMLAIAFIGVVMTLVRQLYFANTLYARGYDEDRFQQIRAGMTSEEVEALVGPPLKKYPWAYQPSLVGWCYTDKRRGYGDYWKREVFLEKGKVVDVVSNYWVD